MAITRTVPNTYAPWVASAALSRRVAKVVCYQWLSEMSDLQRREFHEALLDADSFDDLPGKWQAATGSASRTGVGDDFRVPCKGAVRPVGAPV
jgi:hypothetical protein